MSLETGTKLARHVPLSGTFNCRDVGGYPTVDGATTRWRTLFRADGLHWLTDGDRQTMREFGLRTVVDLREVGECERFPDALDGFPLNSRSIPIFDGRIEGWLQRKPMELPDVFEAVVDECGAQLAAAVRELCQPDALPGLVHCSAGKDRTGLVIALALSVVGVPDAVIADDFAMSSLYIGEEFKAAIKSRQATSGMPRVHGDVLACPPQLVLNALERIRNGFGSVPDYLLRQGLTAVDLDRLRATLIE